MVDTKQFQAQNFSMRFTVSAFYKFIAIENLADLKSRLLAECKQREIKGTILLAPEGINATISGAAFQISDFLNWLRTDPRFENLETKKSFAQIDPFQRLKVKLKPEIITLREANGDPRNRVGTYVRPDDWNALIEDPAVTVIDTRNDYEVGIGTFKGALDPQIRVFHEFPDFAAQKLDPKRHTKIAMFCTGGIRCEKASSYLLSQGFEEVYHLQGGILKYLETVPEEESLWQGECFVFDERVSLRHGTIVGTHVRCAQCGDPTPRLGDADAAAMATVLCRACAGFETPES